MIFPLLKALFNHCTPEKEFSSEAFAISWELISIIWDFNTNQLGLRRNYLRDNLNQLGLYPYYLAGLLH
ncbi:hypothetical protein [Parabacteroides chongii]|uniref:hypothetical protein n=1 Tax=Parabacteroides chongii TaxID=2685834 RepID=UPI00240D9B69|nr:hypothetical protein [Parabacteroides chongii]WFE86982.1 hypothetical protein P3L47_10510 [Parabacteroides chongii]